MLENSFNFSLLVIIIFFVLLIPMELIPKFKNNKKLKIIVITCLLIISVVVFITHAIIFNPKVEATIHDDYVQFKTDEKVYFDNIEEIQYLENVDLAVTANGFRWGNDNYYSGDADVEAISQSDASTIMHVYKGKVYISWSTKDYIVIKMKTPSKTFVFNYNTEKETQDMFEKLQKNYSLKK